MGVDPVSVAPAGSVTEVPSALAGTAPASSRDVLRARLERDFTYRAPKGDQPGRYQLIRSAAKELALLVAAACPDSRERSTAFTKLDEFVFWANASIARNE